MRVFIKTYGCSFNQADSENMAGLLKESGRYKLVGDEKDADLVIVNSCTVKNGAETKFWRDVRNTKKKLILAGCVPQAEKDKGRFAGFSIIGTSQISKVVHVADEILAGNTVQLFGRSKDPRINIPKVRRNELIEIVPINEGCLGSCTFCKSKFARGHLYSYSPESIVRHIRDSLNDGAKEIWLTSQDTACYGYDIKTNLPNLLKEILKIDRDFRLRIGMGNPDYLPDFLEDLLRIYSDRRVYKFLHIPVQAGSDRVLKMMKREYDVKTYIDIIAKVKTAYPDLTISTDIICGFPGETDDDFNQSLKLMSETRPDVLNISRFWARPGTIAAKQKQLDSQTILSRSRKMTALYKKIAKERNRKWLGWKGEVFINEIGKNNTLMGRNDEYKPIVVKEGRLGDIKKVRIIKVETHYLIGQTEN